MTTPGLADLLRLDTPLAVRVDPTGGRVAVTVQNTRWEENRYGRDVIVVDVASGRRRRLTRGAHVSAMRWLGPETLAVLRSDGGPEDPAQVVVYEGLMGDGWRVTDAEHGIFAFEPFRAGILTLSRDAEDPAFERREERFGTYHRVEGETNRPRVAYLDLDRLATFERARARADKAERETLIRPEVDLTPLLRGPLAVTGVVAVPSGDAVYVNARPSDDLTRVRESSVHRIEVADDAVVEHIRRERRQREESTDAAGSHGERGKGTADTAHLGRSQQLVLPPRSSAEAINPDGDRLLLRFPGAPNPTLTTHTELWAGRVQELLDADDEDVARAALVDVTTGVDEYCFEPIWHDGGIDVLHAEGTGWAIRRLSPAGDPPARIDTGEVGSPAAFHTGADGRVALVGDNATTHPEAWVLGENGAQRLTDLGEQIQGWELGEVRTLEWESRDGTMIQGVLRLPPDFDPTRRHPLAFVVHGGPSWVDNEKLLPGSARAYYPEVQLAAKGVIVLHPNYRGSIGRGRAFRELNVGNLGVGDLWDLESAIDHLDRLGWIDTDKVGCMGWSQGGYISAFAGLHSERFAAVSVGAGISDWYTYAISNDIPDFTRDFVGTDLFGTDRTALTASAPIAAIERASTPMLIQHGSKDRRVPVSNAMELYRGLQEKGVPVELFLFPDFGHPITRPREHHAVLHQNLTWFSHWLLGEDLDLEGTAPDGDAATE